MHRMENSTFEAGMTGLATAEYIGIAQHEREQELAPAGGIRECRSADMRGVAALFQKTFRDPRRSAPDTLATYLHDLFLDHPSSEPDISSRVCTGTQGDIAGFIGILPARMTLGGRPIRAAIAGSLMVDNPAGNPLAGARLLRFFLGGPQDLSISESANPVSLQMWEWLGHKPVVAYSIDWVRILRPFGFTVAALAERRRQAALLAPVASVADRLVDRVTRNRLHPDIAGGGRIDDADVGDDELIAHIPGLTEQYALRPLWDDGALRWILTHAARKRRHGATFKRMVYDRHGQPLGAYIYYGRPRGIAWVLHVLSRPDAAAVVVDNLLGHAFRQGCVAVRGRSHPGITDVLMRRKAFFVYRSSLVAHSSNPEIMSAIRSENAMITGLAGEAWARIIGDTFD